MKPINDDPDALVREEVAADLLNVSVRTLQSWRLRRAGPPFVQVGRAVRYRRRDLISWIEANTVGSFPKGEPTNELARDQVGAQAARRLSGCKSSADVHGSLR